MEGQTSPIPILPCALYRALHTLMCLEVHSLNRSLQDRTCSSRLFPNSSLTTHLMMARTGAQDVPEATELRGSNGKGGGGEAESWAARERCRLEAEGGAFPVGRERAWPDYKSGQERGRRTLSCGVSVGGTVGPIPGISQVTLSHGSLDAPNSRDPIPDFRSSGPFKLEPGFRPALQIPGTGPLNGLRISGS